MSKQFKILVINPGSTSTKIALFEGHQSVFLTTVRHSSEELSQFNRISDQYSFRKQIIVNELIKADVDLKDLDAVIGRGGLVKPVESGVYEINDALRMDLINGVQGEHASNLGGLIALEIASESEHARAFIADPVVVDELSDVARISGLPEFPRKSIFHALNQKAVARRYARMVQRSYDDMNLIVVHLGGGISVGVHQLGKVVEVNNALDGFGPFSPERAGTISAGDLVKICCGGQFSQDVICKMLNGRGGLMAHLGTSDVQEVLKRIGNGDEHAALIMNAMIYHIAQSIGASATVVNGRVDAILITGGMAHSDWIVQKIKERVEFIASVVVFPGEDEMQALAENALSVLDGRRECKIY